MRYLRAILKNYIGIYNGMGLYEIDLDFTKCQHNIVLITGRNGSGKSVTMNSINPFPDGSSSFIPDKTAEKILTLSSDGDIYNIQIISPCDVKGRKTTKAYIQKNGIELNENGNVSSYKDIIFSEFELDSNYVSLSRLSGTDRGIADKTPAERKKFTSNIIDNLEVYNSMFKTLNKKSLIYKSHINTLHTKIQNIGDKQTLDQRLTSLQNREAELNSQIMTLNNQIVSIQAKNSIDEEEARAINDLSEKVNTLSGKVNELESRLNIFANRTKIKKEDAAKKYNSDKDLLTTYTAKHSELSTIWMEKTNRLSEVSNSILTIEADLANTDTDSDIADRYKASKQTIDEYLSQLNQLQIPINTDMILPLTNYIAFADKIVILIDHFMDNMSSDDITFVIQTYSNIYIQDLIAYQQDNIEDIEEVKVEIAKIQSQISLLSTLENRPSNCKIDKCPFISEALNLKKSLTEDPIERLSELQDKMLRLSDLSTEIQKKIDYTYSMSSKRTEYDAIRSSVLENREILSVLHPEFIDRFDDYLINMYSFNELRDHDRETDGLNLLKLYSTEYQTAQVLEAEYKGYREKIQLLNSNRTLLENLKKEQSDLVIKIKELKSQIDSYKTTIDEISNNISTLSEYNSVIEQYNAVNAEYKIELDRYNEYQRKSNKALEALSNINGYRADIDRLSNELNPIMQEISRISGQLTLLDSYYIEYNQYKSSFDLIETVKKYCNPTGGGIQTLFMQIYMSKTKDTANEVLSMLFNGSYKLLDFVINENEFRIPFIGEGMAVDDISSGSNAQISMMGMIINLVLLHQASTKFNIAQLDEIGQGLDNYNSSQFINVLFHCMNILNIEQLFLISHSTESDNTYADIIKLKGYDDYESSIKSGNIIWDFDEVVKGE